MRSLLIFDMDGTIFEPKNWLELHRKMGTWDARKKATDEWLYKKYDTLVDIVIHNLWKGKPAQPFLNLVNEMKYLPCVESTIKALKARGYEIALITSDPSQLMERAMEELGIKYGVANHLEIREGTITGRLRHDDGTSMWPVQSDNKVPIAQELARSLGFSIEEVIAVGDEKNDVPLFKAVGLSIVFNDAPEELRAVATHVLQ